MRLIESKKVPLSEKSRMAEALAGVLAAGDRLGSIGLAPLDIDDSAAAELESVRRDLWELFYLATADSKTLARAKKNRTTVAELAAMYADQNGRCAICEEPPDKRGLVIDHNHTTGEVRGFLCHRCNSALGLLGDDPKRVQSAVRYLDERGHYGESVGRIVDGVWVAAEDA